MDTLGWSPAILSCAPGKGEGWAQGDGTRPVVGRGAASREGGREAAPGSGVQG